MGTLASLETAIILSFTFTCIIMAFILPIIIVVGLIIFVIAKIKEKKETEADVICEEIDTDSIYIKAPVKRELTNRKPFNSIMKLNVFLFKLTDENPNLKVKRQLRLKAFKKIEIQIRDIIFEINVGKTDVTTIVKTLMPVKYGQIRTLIELKLGKVKLNNKNGDLEIKDVIANVVDGSIGGEYLINGENKVWYEFEAIDKYKDVIENRYKEIIEEETNA